MGLACGWRILGRKCCRWAQVAPPRATFLADVERPTELSIELRTSNRPENYTPDVLLAEAKLQLDRGEVQPVVFDFDVDIDAPRYLFYCLRKNNDVSIHRSEQRVTGILSVTQKKTCACPTMVPKCRRGHWRRVVRVLVPRAPPGGLNLALTIDPPLDGFEPQNVVNGVARPTNQPNAWVAALDDPLPTLTLQWSKPQTVGRIELSFDTDFDHPMETCHWGHPERAMPFCVKHYRICDDAGRLLHEQVDNHQTRNMIILPKPVTTVSLQIELMATQGAAPAALFEIRCYAR